MFRFTRAICRKIPRSIVQNGLRLEEPAQELNFELAVKQHEEYMNALRKAGIKHITLLEADEGKPDCVFVEDTAIIVDNKVLVTNPGADSRKPEVEAIHRVVENDPSLTVSVMQAPATVDGGDVMFTGQELFVGLTRRTNEAGIQRIKEVFPGVPVHSIEVNSGTLHLKSMMSMVGENTIIFGGSKNAEHAKNEVLRKATYRYDVITVPDDSAANCVIANGFLLHRDKEQFPESFPILESLPIRRISLNASELAKVDGALTCCSLLY